MWVPEYTVVEPEGEAKGWLLMLHGILGSGSNWRGIARKLVVARPEWGAVLVDLRMHGRSQEAPPPHTVDAAAADLDRLVARLGAEGRPVRGVLGHSFGGKVALAVRAGRPGWLLDTWIIDSNPGPRAERGEEDPVGGVLHALRAVGPDHADRAAFVTALSARGLSRPLGDWLAMNLEPADDRYRMRLDLDAIGALLDDHDRSDRWPALEGDDLPGAAHVVLGGRSFAVGPADRERLERLAAAGRLELAVIERAGHWVHSEAPAELLAILSDGLATLPASPGTPPPAPSRG